MPSPIQKFVGNYGVWIAFVGAIGLGLYPILIDPYLNPQKWQDYSEKGRRGIKQEDIQPGDMKVWSDPFDRPGKTGSK